MTHGPITLSSGTLSGVTFDGLLNMSGADNSIHLDNGTTVVGSSGSGAGVIKLTGSNDALYFDNNQTVSDETIYLGSDEHYAAAVELLATDDASGAGNQVLTLAKSTAIWADFGKQRT